MKLEPSLENAEEFNKIQPKSSSSSKMSRITQKELGIVVNANSTFKDPIKLKRLRMWSYIISPWWTLWIGIGMLIYSLTMDDAYSMVNFWGILEQAFFLFLFIKYTVKRRRPYLREENIARGDHLTTKYGFPSGHSLFLSVSTTYFFWEFHLPIWFLIFAIMISIIGGIIRIYLGVHYPTDIAMGVVIGLISNYIFYSWTHAFFFAIYRPDLW